MRKVIGLLFVLVLIDGAPNLPSTRLTPRIITSTWPFRRTTTTPQRNRSILSTTLARLIFCYSCGHRGSFCPEPMSTGKNDVAKDPTLNNWCIKIAQQSKTHSVTRRVANAGECHQSGCVETSDSTIICCCDSDLCNRADHWNKSILMINLFFSLFIFITLHR